MIRSSTRAARVEHRNRITRVWSQTTPQFLEERSLEGGKHLTTFKYNISKRFAADLDITNSKLDRLLLDRKHLTLR
uniref:Uncharacterized protein n=1 Tax=Heterorhabditis bacteriophora TaxID=37862 RepID=A0A1I7WEI9_HETBA